MNDTDKLLKIFNDVLDNNNLNKIKELNSVYNLRDDLGFDSFSLAELTVKIESEFGIDIFEEELVETVNQVINKINC